MVHAVSRFSAGGSLGAFGETDAVRAYSSYPQYLSLLSLSCFCINTQIRSLCELERDFSHDRGVGTFTRGNMRNPASAVTWRQEGGVWGRNRRKRKREKEQGVCWGLVDAIIAMTMAIDFLVSSNLPYSPSRFFLSFTAPLASFYLLAHLCIASCFSSDSSSDSCTRSFLSPKIRIFYVKTISVVCNANKKRGRFVQDTRVL